MGLEEKKKVWVVGHKNPDTDSICAAIAYANLKNIIDEDKYEPKRAGELNEETKYVLRTFGVKSPGLITDVGAQVKDIEIRKTEDQRENIIEKSLGNDEGTKCCDTSHHRCTEQSGGIDHHGRYCDFLYGCL
ncbi:MAG: DHH family phosphoesterase [Eubacterium sp.]